MEVLIKYLASRPTSRRSIRCAAADRDVEVAFVVRGIFPFRRLVAVASCTAFEPAEAVACPRRCLDSAFRRQWEPPLPVRH